jgi:hypothetical protein
MNIQRDLILRTSINAQGIEKVGLVADRIQQTRSVAVLVAESFVDNDRPAFNTPIHLNGDRRDCRAANLVWRPRWFAVRFHRQFFREDFYLTLPRLICLDTEEVFNGKREASVKYGLIGNDLLQCAINEARVFPTNQSYRILD